MNEAETRAEHIDPPLTAGFRDPARSDISSQRLIMAGRDRGRWFADGNHPIDRVSKILERKGFDQVIAEAGLLDLSAEVVCVKARRHDRLDPPLSGDFAQFQAGAIGQKEITNHQIEVATLTGGAGLGQFGGPGDLMADADQKPPEHLQRIDLIFYNENIHRILAGDFVSVLA